MSNFTIIMVGALNVVKNGRPLVRQGYFQQSPDQPQSSTE